MKKCIIHAGLHKTGSTYIQEFFQQNRAPLLSRGINYFNCQSRNHSAVIYSLYTSAPENYTLNRNKGICSREQALLLNQKLAKKFFRELQLNSSPYFLISGEDISRLSRAELSRLRADIAQYFDESDITVYVRSPHSWLTSLANHRTGDGLDLPGAQRNFLRSSSLRNTLEKMIAAFGREHVLCRQFPSKMSSCQNIAFDFMSIFDMSHDTSQLRIPPRLNEAFSVEALNVLGRIYSIRPDLVAGNAALQEKQRLGKIRNMLRHVGQTRYVLTDITAKKIANIFHDDLQWLQETFGIELEQTTSPSSPQGQPLQLADTEEALASLLLRIIVNPSAVTSGAADEIENLSLELNRFQSLKAQFYHHFGIVLLDTGNPEKALKAFAAALELDPELAWAYIESSHAYSQIKETGKAIGQLKAALELNGNFPDWHCQLGMLLLQHGELDNAAAAFRHALELDAGHEAAQFHLKQISKRKRPMARAFSWLERLWR